MTNYGPSTAFLLVGGKDLSSDSFTLKDGVEELTEEVGGLGRTFDAKKGVGVGIVTLEAQGGLYDDRAAGNIEALQGKSGARQLVSYGYAGTAPGADVVMLDGAIVTKFNRVIAKDALTKAEPEYLISADYMRGVVLHGLTEETADFDTEADSVDNLAPTPDGAVADAHVTALDLDGHTSLDLAVLGSADDISFAPIGIFAAVTVAGTAERIEILGTVPQYLAVSGDFTGTPSGASPSAVPYVALYRF